MIHRLTKGFGTAAACILASTVASFGADVILKSNDGVSTLTGELVEYDGSSYRIRTSFGEFVVNAATTSCEGVDCPGIKPTPVDLNISGSAELVNKILPPVLDVYATSLEGTIEATDVSKDGSAQAILNENGHAIVSAKLGAMNATDSFDAMLKGEANFALTTRAIQPREARAFKRAGFGDMTAPTNEHIVALDGLVIVTSPTNPVHSITEQNVARVFAGRITNWNELGGNDAPINVYIRDGAAGNSEVFNNLIMRQAGLEVKRDSLRVQTDDSMAKIVANDPNAIGFMGLNGSDVAKPLNIEGVCGLQTPATPFTIRTEEYPLTRLVYLYTQDDTTLETGQRQLLDFMNSSAAQVAFQEAGLVGQLISDRTVDQQGLRLASAIVANPTPQAQPELAEMVSLLISARRLSTTLRFQRGSSKLDPRANADVERLAQYLRDTYDTPKEVFLVGFTDSIGDNGQNKELSRGRAAQVMDTILERHPDLDETFNFTALGYGEISPLGCNETEVGRRINRRVEVWVRDVVASN